MPQQSHWPFNGDSGFHAAGGFDRSGELQQEKARLAERAALRQQMRHNRLIIGGRAHTKKRGLS
ncbi:MAG: hypothetical protein Q8K89_04855 [Actinomycetota bacterium]|nr:hypothetical protein [Actinomycetota bacterium]